MLISWCVSVEVNLFRTNLDTVIDFWFGRILGRTHTSDEYYQSGAYEGIEVKLLEYFTEGTAYDMYDCLLLVAFNGSL